MHTSNFHLDPEIKWTKKKIEKVSKQQLSFNLSRSSDYTVSAIYYSIAINLMIFHGIFYKNRHASNLN